MLLTPGHMAQLEAGEGDFAGLVRRAFTSL
jgi:hypothetical protein